MKRWQLAVLAGAFATLACLGALAWTSARERDLKEEELERETRVVAFQFSGRIHSALEKHRIAMEQLATALAREDEITQTAFYDLAAATARLTPLCLRIPLLDPSLRVRWVFPPEPNRSLVGYDARTHPEGYATARRAIESKALALSAPLELVGGAQGFVLSTPIFRDDRLLGVVVCSMRSADFFSEMVLAQVLERYEAAAEDSGTRLFASAGWGASGPTAPGVADTFALGGRAWRLEVRPRAEVYEARLRSGAASYWTLGCLLALAVGAVACASTWRASEMSFRLKTQDETLKKTRERLDGAVRQLLQAEKLTALGELVAGVAHEINNPLAGVLGYTQLVLREDLASDVRRRLEIVCSEAERAGRIVRNLLTFARKHPPEKKYLGLNGIIEKTLELKAYHFRVSQIQVEKHLAADLPKTMLDFHQIQQVLLNLLNNAEQSLAETGRGGTIRLLTRCAGDRIEALVSDTGPGIPAELLTRIFEPFFTTKKDGKGTGLGLSLCYGIVQEHGGSIRAQSEPGRGATFVMEFPVVKEAAAAAETGAGAPAAPAGRLQVLVVDDEPSVQGILVDLLTASGHRVDTASDVPEAVHKIEQGGYDLIISDMKMPHGTGRDIYRTVAKRRPHLARRIVFTSGDGAMEQHQSFLKETGGEVLLKPYRLEEIERVVSAVTKR